MLEFLNQLEFPVQIGILIGVACLLYFAERLYRALSGLPRHSNITNRLVNSAIMILAASWFGAAMLTAMSALNRTFPAYDAEIFNETNKKYAFQVDTIEHFIPPFGSGNVAGLKYRRVEIRAKFPAYVRKDNAFKVSLELSANNHRFPAGRRSARLRAPSAFEIHHRCKGETDSERESTCIIYSDIDYWNFVFSWTLTPVTTGKYSILIDDLDMKLGLEDIMQWVISKQIDYSMGATPDGHGGITGIIALEIQVLTTLGISQENWDLLKIIGAIFSAIFGAGFIWQLKKEVKK